jgi:hypothetical protein
MTMIVYMARSHYRSILYVGLPIEKAQNWVWIVYEWWCNLPKRSLVRWPYRISHSTGVKKTSAIKAYITKANWNPMALPRGWISSSISYTIIWNACNVPRRKTPTKCGVTICLMLAQNDARNLTNVKPNVWRAKLNTWDLLLKRIIIGIWTTTQGTHTSLVWGCWSKLSRWKDSTGYSRQITNILCSNR